MASTVLQIFSFVYLLLLFTCTASLLSHHEECLALFQFKQTILHQNYNDAAGFQKFDSWSNTSDSDCCLFDGVVCSNTGHVIGLHWSRSSLGGIIDSSSTLFKLVHLQVLDLSMNNFVESQIPHEIAGLTQLRSLDLSNSGFNGQIPNEISRLIQLSSLDLSGNPLRLQSPGLEYLLENVSRLEFLNLSGVDLSSSVPRILANFSSLRSIILSGCQLQGEFPSAIFHLPKLNHLSMKHNPNLTGFLPEFHNNSLLENLNLFSTGFAGIIPESISNLRHIEVLSLGSCYFSGHIPGSLPNLTQLTYLSISKNELTGQVPSLASLSKLTDLDLGFNSFEIGHMYDWINKLTKLTVLDLDHMNIHDEILPYLGNLTNLNFVSMAGNFIFGHIPSSFMNLTQLTLLDLRINQLQGQISSSFSNFKSLENLNLGHNNFSGKVGIEAFLGLDKLELLALDGNSLSFVTTTNYTNDTLPELKYLGLASCNLKEFPAFLRYQRNLIGLFLYNNEIEGFIPNWIWNNNRETLQIFSVGNNLITGFHQHPRFLPWINLEAFDVSYNQLQGQLPIPPQTIILYDVSNNNLTGEIPPWICELKFLQLLDLSSNMMTGTLPPCLSNLKNSLSVLDLKRNDFHGPMVSMCTHGSLLKTIDLSENQFTGQVSKSLANCTNLEFLSLADNSFEDVFPLWLGTLPKLQVVILRSNKFYGEIQGLTTISSQFSKLRIIDISNNAFSGQLPDKAFHTWNAMKSAFIHESYVMISQIPFDNVKPFEFPYSMTLTNKGVKREYTKILNIFTAIDLSCNKFDGHIPQSLQDLHGLQSLNLSNNHFTGHFLPSLGYLKNLESLDLSQNELSGQIPQQLLQLGFLAILNVSFNNLDGHIPQGKQFNTFDNNSYLGNPQLCGKPLSKECEKSKAPSILPPTSSNEYESLLPSDKIDWMVILLGVGSGLVVGIIIGNFVYSMYGDWLLERFGMRNDRWVRPLRNTRKNYSP
ncbi:receptor-like protein 7 [Helianthus annuus]|nr:receptor-like protein 7 [Helianthus annuus]